MAARFLPSQLRVPILCAPMASVSTHELAMAVSNAGGIGSLAFAYTAPDAIKRQLTHLRAVGGEDMLVNANFFVFQNVDPKYLASNSAHEALTAVATAAHYGDGLQLPAEPYFIDLEKQLNESGVWDRGTRPQMLSFHFGIPNADFISRAHANSISIGVTATSVSEARLAVAAGVDIVTLQGIEAGGHRGTFDPAARGDERLSSFQLLQRVVDEVPKRAGVEFVLAGGIMTGIDIKRAIDSGAAAAQLGTAFLTTRESGAHKAFKRLIIQADAVTTMTTAFSGRLARAIENDFCRRMEGRHVLPFPVQNTLTRAVRNAAEASGDVELMSMYAGMNFMVSRNRGLDIGAAELMRELVLEMAAPCPTGA